MLNYVNQQVNLVNSLTTLSDLGDLAYSIAQVTLIARLLDVTKNTPYGNIFTLNDLEARVNEAEAYSLSLQNEYSTWDYCIYSDMMNENLVPYWEYSDPTTAKKDTLPNVIKSLILKVFST